MQLNFDNAFVRDLPGDPEAGPGPRQVEGALYSHVAPTPVPAPQLLAHAREVATLLDLRPTRPEQRSVRAGVRWQRPAGGHAAVGQQLRWPPVRAMGRPAGRRPRDLAGRGGQRPRPALGTAAEGGRPHAVLARGRRARGAALVDPRVPVQRGDAPPGRADHARVEPGRYRARRGARHVLRRPPADRAWGDRVPGGAVVHPLRPFRAAVCAQRRGAVATTGRLHHSARLSAPARRRPEPLRRLVR